MKPTAMQNSAEKDVDKMMAAIPVIPRPKYSTTISVGGNSSNNNNNSNSSTTTNSVRPSSSASLTSPLHRRLSGDLIQILGNGDTTARSGYVSPIPVAVAATDDRKNSPTLIASRGYREPVLLKTSSVPSTKPPNLALPSSLSSSTSSPSPSSSLTPSLKPPMLALSSSSTSSSPSSSSPSFAASVKSPHSQYFASPLTQTPIRVTSASPAVRSSQVIPTFPRSNSGGSAVASPDSVSSDKMNGHSDSSVSSETGSFQLNDFYASLPSLPGEDDFVSPRRAASPPKLESPRMKPIVVSLPPQQPLQSQPSPQRPQTTLPPPPPPPPPQPALLSEPPQRDTSSSRTKPNNPVSASSSKAGNTVAVSRSAVKEPVPASSSELNKALPVTSIDANITEPVTSPSSRSPKHQAKKTKEAKRPKSSPHHHKSKSKKAPRPSVMSGISENGVSSEGGGAGGACSADGCGGAMEIPPETFYVNVKSTPEPAGDSAQGQEEDEEASFAGRRDLTDSRSVKEKRIVGVTGTVRGFRNRVRAGIATFLDRPSTKTNYLAQERGQIVVYVTSMAVVRGTHERCGRTRQILHTHMVRYEQRDVYLSHHHQRELRERLGLSSAHEVPLPQIFIDGQHLGGASQLEKLNESGELRKILHRFPKLQRRGQCEACGGFRFVPCEVCHGSRKSLHRNHFTEEFSALRCTQCNENGLQPCPLCPHHPSQ